MAEVLLEVEHIVKTFPGLQTRSVDDVSFVRSVVTATSTHSGSASAGATGVAGR